MSYSKRARMGHAMGVFLFLSFVVFGAFFYVAYSANRVEFLASRVDDGKVNEALSLDNNVNDIAIISFREIRREPMKTLPDNDQSLDFGRGYIRTMPDFYRCYRCLDFRCSPVVVLPC